MELNEYTSCGICRGWYRPAAPESVHAHAVALGHTPTTLVPRHGGAAPAPLPRVLVELVAPVGDKLDDDA